MAKLNCWEFMKCGREQGGVNKHLGICPASLEVRLNRVHGGKLAGRACWVVAGTRCGGKEQGTFAQKYHNCEKCDFYNTVKAEEGINFNLSIVLLNKLNHAQPQEAGKNTETGSLKA